MYSYGVTRVVLKLDTSVVQWVEAAAAVGNMDRSEYVEMVLRQRLNLTKEKPVAQGVSFTRGPDFTASKLCFHCWSDAHRSADCSIW